MTRNRWEASLRIALPCLAFLPLVQNLASTPFVMKDFMVFHPFSVFPEGLSAIPSRECCYRAFDTPGTDDSPTNDVRFGQAPEPGTEP
jgi:hypothetical protein